MVQENRVRTTCSVRLEDTFLNPCAEGKRILAAGDNASYVELTGTTSEGDERTVKVTVLNSMLIDVVKI